ncbi:hypothetical protein EI94DRAFT_1749418 [Lactarius quietus]|nr:hypothetical protein EI94DRAFT_1749418 [Lactarius quietus]
MATEPWCYCVRLLRVLHVLLALMHPVSHLLSRAEMVTICKTLSVRACPVDIRRKRSVLRRATYILILIRYPTTAEMVTIS